jgi:hypothetical protein
MKTIFDADTHAELQSRLEKLAVDSPRQWGTMTPSQALEHTARALEMASGAAPLKQLFMGKLLSWMFKSKFLGPEPFPQNAPTGPTMKIADEPDFEATRERLRTIIEDFHTKGPTACDGNVHGFFGKLTGDEWGICQYKHVDHHLRQFGV